MEVSMNRALVAACASLVLVLQAGGSPAARGLEVYWCDVEGGAATLIVTPAGESILVDTGWAGERDAQRIVHAARDLAGIEAIDHLITTHWHTDHIGGVADLAKRLPIRRFYDHGPAPPPATDVPAPLMEAYQRTSAGKSVVLRAGDEIRLRQAAGAPRVALRVVASGGTVVGEPAAAAQIRTCSFGEAHAAKPQDDSDNARSVSFVLSFGDWSLFDAGDLTWNVEHKLACPKNLPGPVTVYQVTHHGMDSSSNPVLVRALAPRVAVMNNGARKAGSPEAVRTVKGVPGLQALFALHRNIATGADVNAAPELTANDAEPCAGNLVKLAVAPDSKSFTVAIPAKGTTRSFSTR